MGGHLKRRIADLQKDGFIGQLRMVVPGAVPGSEIGSPGTAWHRFRTARNALIIKMPIPAPVRDHHHVDLVAHDPVGFEDYLAIITDPYSQQLLWIGYWFRVFSKGR
jgi:hypothetical protein